MNRLLTPLMALALAGASCHGHLSKASPLAAEGDVGGKWRLAMDSPHGKLDGSLDLKQAGTKLTGELDLGMMGKGPLSNGKVEGKKVSFAFQSHGPLITFNGTVDGAKMSGDTDPPGGNWTATRATSAASKSVLGTVTAFKIPSLEIGVEPDNGRASFLKFSPQTEVLRVPPGERSLEKATPAAMRDIAPGDRVLVSFVDGMTEARRIVVVSAGDISRRNLAEKQDWQERGVSGIVTAVAGNEVTLENRTPQGVETTILAVNNKTHVRRYAPDSVKFSDAEPSNAAAIAKGDQVRARGNKSGNSVAAEDLVFGTFLTRLGTITSVDRETRKVAIQEIDTKLPLTIKLTADTVFKTIPSMRMQQMAAGGGHSAPSHPPDVNQMIVSLPEGKLEDLKVGGAVILTCTRGTKTGEATAILFVGNADPLLEMAKSFASRSGDSNMSAGDAIVRMHGGMMGGPGGGLALPGILPQ